MLTFGILTLTLSLIKAQGIMLVNTSCRVLERILHGSMNESQLRMERGSVNYVRK